MSVRLTLVLSDDLIREIDRVVEDDASSRAEVFRKALQLFLVARAASRHGLKLGLVEPRTGPASDRDRRLLRGGARTGRAEVDRYRQARVAPEGVPLCR